MKAFNEKKKSLVWIVLTTIFFIFYISGYDQFFSGSLLKIILALFGVAFMSSIVGFIGLFAIEGILSLFSPTKKEKITIDKITVSDDDRKKLKSEINEISLKLKKKLTDISKAFKIYQEYTDKEVRDIISKKLKGTNSSEAMSPDIKGGYHFEFKEFKDFSFSISFRSPFNYGCYGNKTYHGISFEYFSELKNYRIKLDTDEDNISEENSLKNLLDTKTVNIIKNMDPKSFKYTTTSRSKLLYEKMFLADGFIDSKIFDKINPR